MALLACGDPTPLSIQLAKVLPLLAGGMAVMVLWSVARLAVWAMREREGRPLARWVAWSGRIPAAIGLGYWLGGAEVVLGLTTYYAGRMMLRAIQKHGRKSDLTARAVM